MTKEFQKQIEQTCTQEEIEKAVNDARAAYVEDNPDVRITKAIEKEIKENALLSLHARV
jgi:hypothetical protein